MPRRAAPTKRRPCFPAQSQIDIATLWLENNEGQEDEREACMAVAKWLQAESLDRKLRLEARLAGIPIDKVRERIRQMGGAA
jgi:hypothetical protein